MDTEDHKAYIVCGSTGEYSDTEVWYVRVFLNEAAANDLCGRLNAWCKERGLYASGGGYRGNAHPPEDPDFRCEYTGTAYNVVPVPLDMANKFGVSEK